MHEASLASQLIEIMGETARENGVKRIISATLELGQLACIDPDTLTFAFDVISRDTIAAGCELKIVRVPLRIQCPACGFEGLDDPDRAGCPSCSHPSVGVISGREMNLVSIDVED
jgi:hydrogenase nickel incorporation protein HypA/HybF